MTSLKGKEIVKVCRGTNAVYTAVHFQCGIYRSAFYFIKFDGTQDFHTD